MMINKNVSVQKTQIMYSVLRLNFAIGDPLSDIFFHYK